MFACLGIFVARLVAGAKNIGLRRYGTGSTIIGQAHQAMHYSDVDQHGPCTGVLPYACCLPALHFSESVPEETLSIVSENHLVYSTW
jgi:hypothetical protein